MLLALLPGASYAQSFVNERPYSYSLYGTPGLIDMPTAQSAADAELATTISHFAGSTRATLSFQISPRLSGSFRYTRIANWTVSTGEETFDRSFDLRYRLVDEGRYRPAVAVGLQDFVGTGIYSGEYIVATKHFRPQIAVTGGIGWGRFGSYNGFQNPLGVIDKRFEQRPSGFTGRGGQLESSKWFRGDAAFFGGISWQPNDKLTLKAEYSSDAYVTETVPARSLFKRRSPLNFGLDYRFRENVHFQAYVLHGSEVGFGVNLISNPRRPAVFGGAERAPLPVVPRSAGSAADLGWIVDPKRTTAARTTTAQLLSAEEMALEGMKLEGRSVTVHVRSQDYLVKSEVIGRTARVLTRTMPASVERFVIVPVENGMPLSAVTVQRSDMESLEFASDNAWKSYSRAQISDAAGTKEGLSYNEELYPKFTWSLGPYLQGSYFDPDNPVRIDVGAALDVRYDIAPGLFLSGRVQHKLVGNRDSSTRSDPSKLPRVRSDSNLYAKADTALTDLTLNYYFRPGKNLYGRVTAGYLEQMYAGVSGELLWKPVSSRLAFGVELNHVKQRDFDMGLDLRDYAVTTGHASAYYDFGNGYHGQLDAGRYLAGDWGATISLDRRFDNGWKIGAYATFTDVPFNDFGEGSFDKGIRISVPLGRIAGSPTGRIVDNKIQPILRDGGARLDVTGRLYETLEGYHDPELKRSWGRFWR